MTYDEWRDTYSKHGMMNEAMAEAAWRAAVAAERERCAQWLRDNYQDHLNIADLCDAMMAHRTESQA